MLYRGTVVEAGDVELVAKDPRHPYTRLLVGSIPVPGVERTWTVAGAPARAAARGDVGGRGCLLEDRCPSAMPVRRTAAPPLFRAATHPVVACHLDREAPAGAMGSAYVEPPSGPAAS